MDDSTQAISAHYSDVDSIRSYSVEAMACAFSFHLLGPSPRLMDSAVMEAEELLGKIEERLSLYVEYSDTSRINRAKAGETVRVTQDMVDCLLQAFDASARLNGKFHPFLGQVAIDQKGQRAELAHLKGLAEDEASDSEPVIALDEPNNTIHKLREGPLLDLGGIGKGYALDRLAALFREWELDGGLIESGGSSFLALSPPKGASAWKLSIGLDSSPLAVSLREGEALASSGELFQGSHVVDPESRSEGSLWNRSYAHARNAAFADAASTASLLMDGETLAQVVDREEPTVSFALYSAEQSQYFGSFFKASS